MRVQRHTSGSVRFDKRRKTWNYLWYESGKRRSKLIGTKQEFPTKAAAWNAVETIRASVKQPTREGNGPTVQTLVEQYRAEKMPRRAMTRQGYNTWLNQYVLPVWGNRPIQELQARPVDLWLRSLTLSPKSKVHIKGMIRLLWDFAMWRGDVPTARNPMELVVIQGGSKRTRQVRSLTVEEFHKLCRYLEGPFHVIALLCASFGLRISECLALRWSDVDWLNSTLRVERGIVHQKVDDVKTPESQRTMDVAPDLLDVLKSWKQLSEFSGVDDWVFASPVKIGRLPISYAGVWRALRKAGARSGVGHLGSHVFRHSYRTWLDGMGTPVGIQQRLMRHSDVRTTMNQYGSADASAMRDANRKIVGMTVNGAQAERRSQ
jgi:integrase